MEAEAAFAVVAASGEYRVWPRSKGLLRDG